MAIQNAIPSHGGETLVTLIKDANEKFCGPASNFLGLKCDGAGSMKLRFEDIDGSAAATVIDITVTDNEAISLILSKFAATPTPEKASVALLEPLKAAVAVIGLNFLKYK